MYYIKIDSNLFGLIYLLNTLFIIFLLVPLTYNYKKAFSASRVSKLIIIILFGIFNSYILGKLVVNGMDYIDQSKQYIKYIFIYKNVFKGILYFILIFFTLIELKIHKLIMKSISQKKVD
jgi:hypothetical protein